VGVVKGDKKPPGGLEKGRIYGGNKLGGGGKENLEVEPLCKKGSPWEDTR